MANNNRPFGLKPVRYINGAPYNGMTEAFHVPATNGANMFLGDPVILTGTGNLATFLNYPPGTLADVAISQIPAAGGAPLTYQQYVFGSIVNIEPITRESTIYRPGSVEYMVHVSVDPNIIYEVQDNGAAAIGIGSIGLNANLFFGAGSTTTGQSGYTLDAGTTTPPSTSLNLQVTIIRGANRINNDLTSPFAVWEVLLNWHPYTAPAIGI